MPAEFTLHIETPEKQFFHGQVEAVVVKGTDGEIGIMTGHSPMVVALVPAALRLKPAGQDAWREAAVTGGFARISGAEVTVFADTAEWPEEIVESRALYAKQRAEERLQQKDSEVEYLRSRVALARALTRLDVKHHNSYNH